MSVSDAFRSFGSRLEITGLQTETVSTRQQEVRAAVARRLRVEDSFLTGSYRRHTMIAPLSKADVDIFVVLNPEYFHANGQAALLDGVRSALRETYPSTPRISANGQAVSITFRDFLVDVVPAFNRRGGGYLIPGQGAWIETNPKVHEAFIAAANFAHDQKLVPLIKMIKGWNRHAGSRLRSFYLELMIESILRGVTISDSPTGAHYVFAHGQEKVKWMMRDPAGLGGGEVPGIAHGSVAEAMQALANAQARAADALGFNQIGLSGRAIASWRQVFGDAFPAR